ncbi:hypothetical protein PRUPE_2G164600, partial [Prunus persica]
MKRNNAMHLCDFLDGTGLHRHFVGTSWRPLKKITAATIIFLLLIFFVAALVPAGWIDAFIFSGAYSKKSITTTRNTTTPKRPEFPLQ